MTNEELLERFGKVQLEFISYYKYQFFFYAEEGNFSFYGTLGDGSPDDIYRMDINKDETVDVDSYSTTFEDFRVKEMQDDGTNKLVFKFE